MKSSKKIVITIPVHKDKMIVRVEGKEISYNIFQFVETFTFKEWLKRKLGIK